VYSIFVSRVDVYTEKQVPDLSPAAQGLVGIVNVKKLWRENQSFWKTKNLPLQQEIIFASTGTKKPSDPPDKYVDALAGSDIQTNPPATNEGRPETQTSSTRERSTRCRGRGRPRDRAKGGRSEDGEGADGRGQPPSSPTRRRPC
jgi:transaldolase